MKKTLIALLLVACSVPTAFAKEARCKVVLEGQTQFYGICNFRTLGQDGSFVLSNKDPRKLLVPEIKELWILMEQKNVAELASVEPDDRFQRWGVTLIRSIRDRACWDNHDGNVSVCAYSK